MIGEFASYLTSDTAVRRRWERRSGAFVSIGRSVRKRPRQNDLPVSDSCMDTKRYGATRRRSIILFVKVEENPFASKKLELEGGEA